MECLKYGIWYIDFCSEVVFDCVTTTDTYTNNQHDRRYRYNIIVAITFPNRIWHFIKSTGMVDISFNMLLAHCFFLIYTCNECRATLHFYFYLNVRK